MASKRSPPAPRKAVVLGYFEIAPSDLEAIDHAQAELDREVAEDLARDRSAWRWARG